MGVRAPAVAGSFYPEDAAALRAEVESRLAGVAPHPVPKVLVAPHAGYVYSGPIAASAYACLRGAAAVRRVVLLGPSHFVRLRGLALPDAEGFQTPLGVVPVDRGAVDALGGFRQVSRDAAPHAREHSLEVQLPFLQRVLADFGLVPLVVGAASPQAVSDVLDALWGGPETLIIVSTDLSHYLSHEMATRMDRETADRVLACGPPLEPERACGAAPLNGLLHAAKARGLRGELWDLRNSGDTAGPKDRVVGYGAFAFREGARA